MTPTTVGDLSVWEWQWLVSYGCSSLRRCGRDVSRRQGVLVDNEHFEGHLLFLYTGRDTARLMACFSVGTRKVIRNSNIGY